MGFRKLPYTYIGTWMFCESDSYYRRTNLLHYRSFIISTEEHYSLGSYTLYEILLNRTFNNKNVIFYYKDKIKDQIHLYQKI